MIALEPIARSDRDRVNHIAVLPEQVPFCGTIAEQFAMNEPDCDFHVILRDGQVVGFFKIDRAIHHGEVLTEQLQTALNSRVVIEQAKGLLAHAGNLPIDETFTLLRDYGRAHSTRLAEIAHQLVTGSLSAAEVIDHHHARKSP